MTSDIVRSSRLRWFISLSAIAAMVPYLSLKILWLSGSRLGIVDPSFGDGTSMAILNGGTAFMDASALLLALSFAAGWGRRVPAPLILLPMWIATGLLGEILIILPMQLIIGVDSSPSSALSPLEPWVFTMVYAGFAWQGVFLILGFTLYAVERWGADLGWRQHLGRRIGELNRWAAASAAGAAALAGLSLVDAAFVDGASTANGLGKAILLAAAGGGVAALAVGRPANVPRWVALAAVWTGSGATFAWGMYAVVLGTLPNDLTPGSSVRVLMEPAAQVVVGLACACWLRSTAVQHYARRNRSPRTRPGSRARSWPSTSPKPPPR